MRKPSSRLSLFMARFARARRGVTAIEFALVSLPLMMLIFGVIELSLVFMAGTTLDGAVQTAGREIRTGEFQSAGTVTPAAFKALVCAKMSWLAPKCASDLWLDVRTFSDFSDLATAPAIPPASFERVGGAPPAPPTCFSPGQPTDIVLVRAYFAWDLITPVLDRAFANLGSDQRLITSTTAFRNEPYNANPPQGASACT